MTSGNAFPILATTRLRLREITHQDADALFAIHGDAEHMRWFGNDPMKIVEEATKLIDIFAGWRASPNPGTRWGIERQADGAFLGTCGLFKWNRSWHSCTLGYELAASAQGHGYMSEALQAALAYGFEQMELNRIEASVNPNNTRSIRVLAELGFLEEGRLREAGYWAGQYHDLLQFALLRRDHKR
jgi:[ribosomal protein S5]-alanine N-acetyltransferase